MLKKLGGISSYCLLILIIVFLKEKNFGFSSKYGEIFEEFLKFYGTEFNPSNTGISFNMDSKYFIFLCYFYLFSYFFSLILFPLFFSLYFSFIILKVNNYISIFLNKIIFSCTTAFCS